MNKEKKHPTWEILGAVVGYIGTVKEVPGLVHTFYHFYEEPFPRCFIVICSLVYLLFLISLASQFLWGYSNVNSEKPNVAKEASFWSNSKLLKKKDPKKQLQDNFNQYYRKRQILSAIRSFGATIWWQGPIALLNYVKLINSFSASKNQFPDEPKLIDHVDRYTIVKHDNEPYTVEYRYSRDLKFVQRRMANQASNGEFGSPEMMKIGKMPECFLTFLSLQGFFWSLGHLLFARLFGMFK